MSKTLGFIYTVGDEDPEVLLSNGQYNIGQLPESYEAAMICAAQDRENGQIDQFEEIYVYEIKAQLVVKDNAKIQ